MDDEVAAVDRQAAIESLEADVLMTQLINETAALPHHIVAIEPKLLAPQLNQRDRLRTHLLTIIADRFDCDLVIATTCRHKRREHHRQLKRLAHGNLPKPVTRCVVGC